MYLEYIGIKNVGAIGELFIKLSFNENKISYGVEI